LLGWPAKKTDQKGLPELQVKYCVEQKREGGGLNRGKKNLALRKSRGGLIPTLIPLGGSRPKNQPEKAAQYARWNAGIIGWKAKKGE